MFQIGSLVERDAFVSAIIHLGVCRKLSRIFSGQTRVYCCHKDHSYENNQSAPLVRIPPSSINLPYTLLMSERLR